MTDAPSTVKIEEPEDPVEQMLTKTGCIQVCCEIRVEDLRSLTTFDFIFHFFPASLPSSSELICIIEGIKFTI